MTPLLKKGLLLINLGTPDAATPAAVKRYLKVFLGDPRVINLPALLRMLLLHTLILPFRSKRSAHAYQAIWTKEGSPLLVYSKALIKKCQARLGEHYHVALGMRYGNPSIEEALATLQDCETLTILPLYPQYSSAATGSSIEKTISILSKNKAIPSIHVIRDFYQHPGYILPQCELIRPYIDTHDHLLLSYHGLPEQQLAPYHCPTVCSAECPAISQQNASCYRAQCYATSDAIAQTLHLERSFYTVVFQSRLGKIEWIKPYLETVLKDLAQKKIRRLAISCPSFVTDCLETLEEIGIRANQQWRALGGEVLTLIPALNDSDAWVNGILDISML